MAANGANGTTNGNITKTAHRFDPNFTHNVLRAPGPTANPRVKQLTSSLIKHLHDFARENEVTVEEWMMAVDFVGPAGKFPAMH